MNIILIPCRLNSQRFPQKVFAKLKNGKTLIQEVYDCAFERAKEIGASVFVCTPDTEIFDKVKLPCIKTPPSKNGTHCAKLAAEILKLKSSDNVIIWQGDLPYLPKNILPKIIPQNYADIYSVYYKVSFRNRTVDWSEIDNVNSPNYVKVVLDKHDYAVYFSRTVIPYNSDNINIHAGLYSMPLAILNRVTELGVPPSVKTENLEQLSWLLENWNLKMVEIEKVWGIDTPADLEEYEKAI